MVNKRKYADRSSFGQLVGRFLCGVVSAGVLGGVGFTVGALISMIVGIEALIGLLLLGVATFAPLGARIAWGGVTEDFGSGLALWSVAGIAAFIVSMFGFAIGYNVITSLPWAFAFAIIAPNVVMAIVWLQPVFSQSNPAGPGGQSRCATAITKESSRSVS